jgi:hypothetical protein
VHGGADLLAPVVIELAAEHRRGFLRRGLVRRLSAARLVFALARGLVLPLVHRGRQLIHDERRRRAGGGTEEEVGDERAAAFHDTLRGADGSNASWICCRVM